KIAFDAELPVGVMIETPASALIADLLAKECDFLALGTNDLIQYALATDRSNRDVAYLYRPCHPAVLRILSRVIEAGQAQGIEVSICGEMAADPFHIPILLGLGLRKLSMTASAIPIVKRMLRRLELSACEAFVREALSMSTAAEIEEALTARLRAWAPDLF
ncbi:MAG: putative PEP-binding protein, partial [Myxococcota bacterium]